MKKLTPMERAINSKYAAEHAIFRLELVIYRFQGRKREQKAKLKRAVKMIEELATKGKP